MSNTSRRSVLFGLSASAVAGPAAAQQGGLSLKGLLDSLGGGALGSVSQGEIAQGLREALRVGTDRTVDRLGVFDGFLKDRVAHIVLPDSLRTVQQALSRFRMSGMADELETRLNRAAETATARTKPIFYDAVQAMTLQDVMGIYEGPQDAATQYFRRSMSPALKDEMRPVVVDGLAQAGAVQAYDRMMGRYASLPFVPDVKADLVNHTLDGALGGIFHYVALEEADIRSNPAARTTDILRRVFD